MFFGIDINDLVILANRKEEDNYRFWNYLKNYANEEELDKQFKRLHEKYFKIYDCKKMELVWMKKNLIMYVII